MAAARRALRCFCVGFRRRFGVVGAPPCGAPSLSLSMYFMSPMISCSSSASFPAQFCRALTACCTSAPCVLLSLFATWRAAWTGALWRRWPATAPRDGAELGKANGISRKGEF